MDESARRAETQEKGTGIDEAEEVVESMDDIREWGRKEITMEEGTSIGVEEMNDDTMDCITDITRRILEQAGKTKDKLGL